MRGSQGLLPRLKQVGEALGFKFVAEGAQPRFDRFGPMPVGVALGVLANERSQLHHFGGGHELRTYGFAVLGVEVAELLADAQKGCFGVIVENNRFGQVQCGYLRWGFVLEVERVFQVAGFDRKEDLDATFFEQGAELVVGVAE